MEDLLKHLLVRRLDGTFSPASSPLNRYLEREETQTLPRFHTILTPKFQASQTQMADGCETPNHAKGHFTPPPSAQLPSKFSYLPNLMSIDDFEKENPITPKLIQIKPTKIILESVVRISELWNLHGIAKHFSYRMNAQNVLSVKLEFLDEVLEADGPFASKRHANEEVCRLALPRMEALDKQLKTKKRKITEDAEDAYSGISSAELKSENFVSILQEYTQRQHFPSPEYTEECTATKPVRFKCTVRIPDGPLTPFGYYAALYPNKNEAKRAAAREAVLWLRKHRGTRILPKRIKTENATPVSLNPGQTGLSQVVNDMHVDTAEKLSLRQQVHIAVVSLGLTHPTFVSKVSTPPPDVPRQPDQTGNFVDMVVTFGSKDASVEPRLAGEVVKVEHVYGEKKAREICCAQILRVFEDIKASRAQEEGGGVAL